MAGPMGGAASKIKGASGERELAKILGTVFNGSFIRSAGSGGYVGGKNAVRKTTLSDGQVRSSKGDLVPPDHMPKFVVEAKSYDGFRFHQLLSGERCPMLDDWIAQTLACIDPGDTWFVAYKVNRLGWFVAVPVGAPGGADPADLHAGYVFGNHCLYTGRHATVRVTQLVEFFMQNRALIERRSLA